ncbi:response regulator [Emticicia sp. 17c]|uniref:response regulator n=1 Tax=Emticicia sp. 17c TaxID=3127704 RepID=UPI00301C42B1
MIPKLLCIDDDETTLLLIEMVVKKAAFAKEVISITSASEALNYYHKLATSSEGGVVAPQLIFLDLNMPVMNGWEFLDEFVKTYAEQFSQTKVVILSSSTNPEDKEKAKNYPIIIGYIYKPITVDLLKKIVR